MTGPTLTVDVEIRTQQDNKAWVPGQRVWPACGPTVSADSLSRATVPDLVPTRPGRTVQLAPSLNTLDHKQRSHKHVK